MELMDFAPYIQFIVGIYFVCMYDKILEINPLHKFFVRSTDKLKKISQIYQGQLNNENKKAIQDLQDEKKVITLWKVLSPSLKCVFTLSFYYGLFLLFYMGMEKTNQGLEQVFIIPSILIVLYIIIIGVFLIRHYNNTFFQRFFLNSNYLNIFIISLAIYVLIFIFFGDNIAKFISFKKWELDSVKFMVLLTSTLGLLLYIFHYIVVWFKEWIILRKLSKLESNLNEIFNYQMGIQKIKKEQLYQIMNKVDDLNKPLNKVIDEYICENVNSSVNKILKSINLNLNRTQF